MWNYRKRLTGDLQRWRENGWVSDAGAAAIALDVQNARRGVGLAPALGILASVLLGFAVLSFVAAHWLEMSRGVRLGLLGSLIAGGYIVAGWLWSRGADRLADAAILFACAAFGASIMLISQMFHIEGRPAEGVALWSAGTALAGVVLRSNPALAFALVLASIWSFMESSERANPHWAYLLPWTLLALAFAWRRWRPGLHLSGLTLAAFIIGLGYQLNGGHAHQIVAALGIAAAAGAIGLARALPEYEGVAAPALGYAIAVAFAGLYALQFVDGATTPTLIVLGAATMLAMLGSIAYGLTRGHAGAIWLGYIGFSIEILSLYWKTVGSILGTSAFFLIAGLLVAALAALAWRLAARGEEARA